jgi:hypothetical protein
VYFDSKDQRLTIIGDRPGCRPLFYLRRHVRALMLRLAIYGTDVDRRLHATTTFEHPERRS